MLGQLLLTQINVLESYYKYISICFKIVMIENVKIMIISASKSKFYQYFVLSTNYSNDSSHFLLNFSAGVFQIESRKPHQLKVSLAPI